MVVPQATVLKMTLEKFLQKNNIEPKSFAKTVGVHRVTVYKWLSGEITPSIKSGLEIEKATFGKVTLKDIYGR